MDRVRQRIDSIIDRLAAGESIDYAQETLAAGWDFLADSLDRHEDADGQLQRDPG